jgi:uncharacterized MAPEG superfamily protein
MTFAMWMILVAILLPVVTTGMAKWGAPGLDNNAPRIWADTLTGWRKRADWCHRNHFEALPVFAAGVLVARRCDTYVQERCPTFAAGTLASVVEQSRCCKNSRL